MVSHRAKFSQVRGSFSIVPTLHANSAMPRTHRGLGGSNDTKHLGHEHEYRRPLSGSALVSSKYSYTDSGMGAPCARVAPNVLTNVLGLGFSN